MPRIRCYYIDCKFLDDGFCGAASVEIDPDTGCSTYLRVDDIEVNDDWDEDTEIDEWDEIDDGDDDDLWLDEDEF